MDSGDCKIILVTRRTRLRELVIRYNTVEQARFPLVVADPTIVRLEPLPIDGQLKLSAICSASVQGATKGDAADDVFTDLAAVQAAYQQVKKGGSGAQDAGKANGADGEAKGGDGAPAPKPKG